MVNQTFEELTFPKEINTKHIDEPIKVEVVFVREYRYIMVYRERVFEIRIPTSNQIKLKQGDKVELSVQIINGKQKAMHFTLLA